MCSLSEHQTLPLPNSSRSRSCTDFYFSSRLSACKNTQRCIWRCGPLMVRFTCGMHQVIIRRANTRWLFWCNCIEEKHFLQIVCSSIVILWSQSIGAMTPKWKIVAMREAAGHRSVHQPAQTSRRARTLPVYPRTLGVYLCLTEYGRMMSRASM